MTIRNFNSIYSSQSTYSSSVDTNQVSSTDWDNKFEGLTLFNSQVSIDKQLFVTGAVTCGGAVNCKNDLWVVGSSTLNGGCKIIGGLQGEQNFIINPSGIGISGGPKGNVTIKGGLTLEGATEGNLGITVTGNSTFDGVVECKSTLKGPADFIIDPSPFGDNAGKVIIKGNLTVEGTTTTVNSTTLDIKDKNITIASGADNKGDAHGAGLTIKLGSGSTDVATLLYEYNESENKDNFLLNKQIRLNADPDDDDALTRRSYVNNGVNITDNTIGFEKLKGFKLKVITDEAPFSSIDIDFTTPCVLYVLNKKLLNETVTVTLTYLPVGQVVHTSTELVLYPGFSMHVYDGSVWSSAL